MAQAVDRKSGDFYRNILGSQFFAIPSHYRSVGLFRRKAGEGCASLSMDDVAWESGMVGKLGQHIGCLRG
jgi:hypothetical protein